MNFDSLPVRLVFRWELAVRAVLALLAPLIVGYLLGDVKAGLLAAIVAANVSIAYLGPDLGFFRWAVVAAVGSAAAAVLGVFISGTIWLEVPFLLVLFAALGAMMLGGLTSQLAFSPVAILGLFVVTLFGGPVTVATVVAILAGAAWSLVLVAVLPRWRGWPRIPVDRNTLAPNAVILRRLFTHPSLRDWAFPLLLGVLVVAAVTLAATIGGSSRSYWAAIALIAVLGPSRQETLVEASRFMAAAFIGIGGALVFLYLPLPTAVTLGISILVGALGALVVLARPMLSKAAIAFLVVTMVTLLTEPDAVSIGGERFMLTAIGVTIGILAAALAEYLAASIEQRGATSKEVA